MPGLTVGVPGAGQRVGQRPVSTAPVLPRRGLVHRRPDQRVAHRERRRVAHEQPGVQGGLQGRLLHAEAGRCVSQHVELAGVVRGSQQQHGLHRLRQPAAAVQERLLDVGREMELRRQGLGPSELGRGQLARQLHQGQRVASRLEDEPPGHLLGRRIVQVEVEEGSGCVRLEAGQLHLAEPLRFEVLPGSLPGGEHHRDPVRAQTACAEEEGTRGGGVQPMGVVDHAEHEVLLGRGRQQRQGRHAHQEGLHRRPVVLSQRHSQGPGLRGGQLCPQPGQWQQQTMERRESQGRLDLESLRAQHRRVRGLDGELVEQGRLPHTRLAAHDQAAGGSLSGLLDQRF